MRNIFLLAVVSALLAAACGQPGDLPLVAEKNPAKGIYYEMFGMERFRPIEMVCYVDTDKYNPLNAADYTLKDSGIRFFDYVILGSAFIRSDSKGYYLDLSENLQKLLSRRNRYVIPLQKKGIRVLLGIQSAGNASFGHLSEDEMFSFSAVINDALLMYGLDGVEFYDSAGTEAHPAAKDFDPENLEGFSEEEWLLEKWREGGSNFNNFFYGLRELFYRNSPAGLPEERRREMRDTPPLILRESGYGRFFPERVWCTDGYADFVGSIAEITYSFNPFPDRFPLNSIQKNMNDYQFGDIDSDEDNFGYTWMSHDKYGPLTIDLDGGDSRNIWYPFKKDGQIDRNTSIDSLFYRFRNGEYQAVYFNNLKSLTAAKEDTYFKWLAFDPGREETPFLAENGDWWPFPANNPSYVPMDYIFTELSMTLFNETVVCSYGEHEKDW
jgi:hypothetical protein